MDLTTFSALVKEGISLAILLPIVWYLIAYNNKQNTKQIETFATTVKEGFSSIVTSLDKHAEDRDSVRDELYLAILENRRNSDKRYISLGLKLGSPVLNKEQTVSLLLANMWMVSYGKLEFIKNILRINHISGREKEIKKRVEAELARQSGTYMQTFSEYLTPIGDLGEWLNKSFDENAFDKFVDNILLIMYSQNYKHHSKEAEIELKINDIATLMKELQNSLAKKLRQDIDNL